MTIEIRDGDLSTLIRNNPNKLIAVDFSNPGCPPCRAIRPFWESLPKKYPTVVFASVECQSCPSESQRYQITATPTFVFILKGSEVHRFQGARKEEIISTLEKYKTTDFAGKARTLADYNPPQNPPNNNNFFEQLLPGGRPVQPVQQQQQQPTPAAPPKPQYDPEVRNELLEMGFPEELVDASFRNSDGSINECLNYIEKVQTGEITLDEPQPPETNPTAPTINPPNNTPTNTPNSSSEANEPKPAFTPHAADAESAAALEEDLGPEGEAMKARLVEMGYDPTLAAASIQALGHDSIEKCIEGIQRMLRGQNLAPPMTPEEIKAKREELQKRIAEKKAMKENPSIAAKNEFQRRKQMQEDMEARKKFEKMQRENELKLAKKEKEQERLERERVLAKIRAQRSHNSNNQSNTSNPQTNPPQNTQNTQPVNQPAPKKVVTECQLRLVFPDNSNQVLKFKPTETLYDVETTLRSVKSGLPRRIGFEIPYPRALISQNQYSLTLESLQLCPRSQLNIKFL